MKLLIVTQKADIRDPILGFFHSWVLEFSQHVSDVIVIAQSVGEFPVPAHIRVLSLGKESGASPFAQVFRFWRLIRQERSSYDNVFVHMVPLWICFGFPLWLVLRKHMYLWYEARGARWPLRVALLFLRKVFSASPHGIPIRTKKSVITGHGIDTVRFAPGSLPRDEGSLVTVGRVTRAKRIDQLLACMSKLPAKFHLRIVGAPITHEDLQTRVALARFCAEHGITDRITMGALPFTEVLPLLHRAEVFVHASETSLDKALLEAMAAECLVLSSSSAADLLPAECRTTPEHFARSLESLLALPASEKEKLRAELRAIVLRSHSLPQFIDRLVREMLIR